MKCLIYCTQRKPYLFYEKYISKRFSLSKDKDMKKYAVNGKIVAEFDCDKVEEIRFIKGEEYSDMIINSRYETFCLSRPNLYSKSCLYFEQLHDYLKGKNGYAIHIKNLKVFDKPLELEELEHKVKYPNCNKCPYGKTGDYGKCGLCYDLMPIKKAPQNMCYAYYNGELCCLISIQPHWVDKILNEEKTIEVRKKVLKGMLNETKS